MSKARLYKCKLTEMACRSFLIQACWNFDRMQNIGFAFSILPSLKKIFIKKREIRDAIKRHLVFFNSHPYFSVFAIGAIARMEEDGKCVDFIQEFKCSLVGPLGAIGDSFFWASLRPTTALLALCFALMGQVWAPILFLVLYNMPHLYYRFKGIRDGYNLEINVIDKIKRYRFFEKTDILRDIGMIFTGYLIALSVYFEGAILIPNRTLIIWFSLLNFALVFFFAFLIKYGIKPIRILWFLIMLSILVGYLCF